MRVLLLVVAVFAASCSDEPDSRPPVDSLKPAGTGWSCFRETLSGASLCDRPAKCEPLRTAYAAELDRTGDPYTLTTCTSRPGVACFTAFFVVPKRSGYYCVETLDECNKTVSVARTSADYRDVSDCGAW